jgi:hypothetical protein
MRECARRVARLVVVGSAAALVAACTSGPPTTGELKTLDAVCDRSLEGKRVAVEGYLLLPDRFLEARGGSPSAPLIIRGSSQPGGTEIFVWMPYGDGPNSMGTVGSRYTQEDLKLRTTDGKLVGYRDKLRISGTLVFPGQNPVTTTNATIACGLNTPLLESI